MKLSRPQRNQRPTKEWIRTRNSRKEILSIRREFTRSLETSKIPRCEWLCTVSVQVVPMSGLMKWELHWWLLRSVSSFASTGKKEQCCQSKIDQSSQSTLLIDFQFNHSYVRAAANARLVGKQLAFLLKGLNKNNDLEFSRVHLIGFSLGAHASG